MDELFCVILFLNYQPMKAESITRSSSIRFLKIAVHSWFAVVVVGQFIFALYILGLYGVSGLAGDFERWSSAGSHGYIEQDSMGNVLFGLHLLLAAIISIGGPLQLIKKVRQHFPKFHRINGRLYIGSAFLISFAGLYLTWIRGTVGGLAGHLFITVNGLLILVCAFFTIQKAVNHQLLAHRKWAIRLFLVMSGVWFFRVFLMLWLTINQGPVGLDMDSFEGPALNMLYTFSYILPILFVEFYFKVKAPDRVRGRWILVSFLVLLTSCILVGTFSATMGMWLPSL